MVGFHQLRVKLRLINKRPNCIGIKEWCINAQVIALAQAMKGHNYYRCMHLHKACFSEPVQFRFEKMKGHGKVLEKHKLAPWSVQLKLETWYEVEIWTNDTPY